MAPTYIQNELDDSKRIEIAKVLRRVVEIQSENKKMILPSPKDNCVTEK